MKYIAAAVAVVLIGCARAARADDLTSTATSAATSKSQFTLLNPVPANQLRGMDTDRPNVTNTPHTIDAGHLQIETGLIDYSYDTDRSNGDTLRFDDLAFAQSNIRLGVLNDLEINAAIDPYEIDRAHESRGNSTTYSRGFGDTVVGAKLNLWGNEGGDGVWQSSLAIQPQFKFPTAHDGLGNGHFEFAVEFPFLINLPAGFHLAGFHLGLQPGISLERNTSNDGNVAAMQNSISIDRVVWNNFDIYLEYASDVTTEKHVEAVQTIDVGGTYPLTDNIVLDTGVAFGLNNATNDVEVLAGMSVRF